MKNIRRKEEVELLNSLLEEYKVSKSDEEHYQILREAFKIMKRGEEFLDLYWSLGIFDEVFSAEGSKAQFKYYNYIITSGDETKKCKMDLCCVIFTDYNRETPRYVVYGEDTDYNDGQRVQNITSNELKFNKKEDYVETKASVLKGCGDGYGWESLDCGHKYDMSGKYVTKRTIGRIGSDIIRHRSFITGIHEYDIRYIENHAKYACQEKDEYGL